MIKRFRKSKGRDSSHTSQNIIILSLIIILFFLMRSDFQLLRKRIRTDEQVKTLQAKADNLNRINSNLKNKLNASLNEEYIEKVLREKGIYKKPDEEAVVIVPGNQMTSSSASMSEKRKNFWQGVQCFIKKLFH